jgi:hypothetical protein
MRFCPPTGFISTSSALRWLRRSTTIPLCSCLHSQRPRRRDSQRASERHLVDVYDQLFHRLESRVAFFFVPFLAEQNERFCIVVGLQNKMSVFVLLLVCRTK